MKTLRSKLVVVLSVLAVMTATLTGSVFAQDFEVPDGFDQTLVYMATGVYDPNDPDYEAPDGDFWHREIMGRSDEEIAENRAEAVDFFVERFGINPDERDDVMFTDFMFDPRNEYRVYAIGGRDVPTEGWVIRDGGWMLAITNPDGVTLGGEFDGVTVPQGTMMVFGDYNIDTVDGDPIIIHYRSGEPIVPQSAGWIAFRCELHSDEFGYGLAQGISEPVVDENGVVTANVRNILTFPVLGE